MHIAAFPSHGFIHGSGVRNLFKYTKLYSGKDSKFQEGDVFRIIVPLDEQYSFDFGRNERKETECTMSATKCATNATELNIAKKKICLNDEEIKILQLIKENPSITQREIQEKTDISMGTIKRILPRLQKRGVLERIENKRSGKWVIKS